MRRYILVQAGKYDGTYYADAHLEPFSGGPWTKAADVEAMLEECRSTLQALYDVQNGCPLPKYEKDWNAAMKHAQALLDRLEEG